MAISAEFLNFITEQLEPMGPLQTKRMFGGAGLYLDGTIFALVAFDTLYLKVDAQNDPDYVAEGMPVFDPFDDPKRQLKSYRECPPQLLEEPDGLCAWARRAWEAARRIEAQKPPPRTAGKKKAPRRRSTAAPKEAS